MVQYIVGGCILGKELSWWVKLMWSKFKKWLNTADEEGLTGYDAICMFCFNLIGFGFLSMGGLFLR